MLCGRGMTSGFVERPVLYVSNDSYSSFKLNPAGKAPDLNATSKASINTYASWSWNGEEPLATVAASCRTLCDWASAMIFAIFV